MKQRSGEGLVLQVVPHGEADLLVTWYGTGQGRIRAIAKGARKSKKRFVNKLEPFTRLQFLYRESRVAGGLYFLEDAELVQAHLRLRQEYARFLAASCAAELCLRFTREQDADSRIYALLTWVMDALEREARCFRSLLVFHLKLLHVAGYMPELGHCSRCGRSLDGPASFDPSRLAAGGALLCCQRCGTGHVDAWNEVSPQSLRLLRQIQTSRLLTSPEMPASSQAVISGLTLLHLYSQYILQTDLLAWPLARRELVPQLAAHFQLTEAANRSKQERLPTDRTPGFRRRSSL